jgi:Lrp/AsnC family transcriptional regulator, leucine-responsive regulatory protein
MSPAGAALPEPAGHAVLDRIDRRLLELLAEDGRMSVATLAERAGISRANAYTRLDRLRQDGVIEGFSVRVSHRRLGFGLTALILVTLRQPAWRELSDRIREWPEVEYCAYISGEHDALIQVRVRDIETLRDVVLERLQTLPDVRATETLFVLDEVVRRPLVLP